MGKGSGEAVKRQPRILCWAWRREWWSGRRTQYRWSRDRASVRGEYMARARRLQAASQSGEGLHREGAKGGSPLKCDFTGMSSHGVAHWQHSHIRLWLSVRDGRYTVVCHCHDPIR